MQKDKIKGGVPVPSDALARLMGKLPDYVKGSFLSAVVLGIATHLYMFANKFPNHDDVSALFGDSHGVASGRWFLPTMLKLDGEWSAPWLIGMLSILCLAVTTCLVVSIFRIHRPAGYVTASALLVSFPTIAGTFSYMFTSSAYLFGLMLAALGAYLVVRHRKIGSLLAIGCLTLSMGIYQSYFPVAVSMMLWSVILEVFDGKKSFKQLVLDGLRLVGVLVASLALYFIIVKITTRNIGLVDYMGLSSMGKIPLSQLPTLIFKSYSQNFKFYLMNSHRWHFGFIKYFMALTGLASVLLLVIIFIKRKLGGAKTALGVVLALLYPMATNLIYIMVPGDFVHGLMIYGTVLLLIAPLALASYAAHSLNLLSDSKQLMTSLASWAIVISMVLTAYSYMIFDNNAYLKMQISYEQSFAYSNRLVSAIQSYEGYSYGTPIVLVGSMQFTEDLRPLKGEDDLNLTGIQMLADMRTSYIYGIFLNRYLGFDEVIHLGDSDLATEMIKRKEVAEMPIYPAKGSIKLIDGYVVVKLAEP